MDKLEYIPGDLVMTKTETNDFTPNGVVCGFVSYCNRNKVFVRVAKGIDTFFLEKEQIIPIPLTQEILEKNGWSKGQIYFRHSRIPRIKLCTADGGFSWSVSINNDIMGGYINYVHELQHILFAFRIEEEMEV